MAVYTHIAEDEARAFLARYDIGEVREVHGIAEGVENSNYLVEAGHQRFILTLFEKRVQAEDLPYFLELMGWLSARGIRCPQAVADRHGIVLQQLKDKPAALVSFLHGKGMAGAAAAPEHLKQLGTLNARMHLAARDFPKARTNALSLDGWRQLADNIGARANDIAPGLAGVIAQELAFLEARWPKDLPGGPVHADLFPDNVFFEGDTLSGVIDFYFACNDFWMYDLAVTLNAWCFDDAQRIVPELGEALIAGYTDIRQFTALEKEVFIVLLRGAALRFLLTRAHDLVFHPPGALVTPKDPLEYMRKLRFFQSQE